MNAAINQDVLVKPTSMNPLDLPDLEQVFYHPTFLKVINELEAPKGHANDFGGFKYRSAEDIQAALKPILLKYKCTVITRKFDITDGFEVYAYIVFKDQKYMRCDLPGVATFDFVKDLASNKKISKTQQYAAYQSYAKKYALCNLLLIDDSQNDLDALTNENIKNEQQNRGKQNYQNQSNNRVVTQADCDQALKQIESLSLDTPLDQAAYIFDGIRAQLPEFNNSLYPACQKKYAEIEQHLYAMQNAQQTTPASNNTGNTQSKNTGTKSQSSVQQQQTKAPPATSTVNPANAVLINQKQQDQLQAFIVERGVDIKSVCSYLGIDSLAQIEAAKLDVAKHEIDQFAHELMSENQQYEDMS